MGIAVRELLAVMKALADPTRLRILRYLSEEELTVFDILTRPSPKLTKKEREQVKALARELLDTLKAERLVLELRDKIGKVQAGPSSFSALAGGQPTIRTEALLALTSLGYNRLSAERAITAAIKDAPLLAPFLLLGLGISFAVLFRRMQPMVAGEVPGNQKYVKAAHVPVILHMLLVLALGLYMPKFLAGWFQTAVGLLK